MISKRTDNEEGIIIPVKRRGDPVVGPDALLVLTRRDLDHLVELNREKHIAQYPMDTFSVYKTQNKRAGSVTMSGPFLGAPHAVMGMEKLIALGAERFWVFGWCGSLQPDLGIGELVVPTQALSEEGTSKHYPIDKKAPRSNRDLNRIIEQALHEKGYAFSKGTVWTTDAPYRETPSKVRACQQGGILAVEMEISALMTLALFRNVQLAGLLVVSDELSDMTWRPGFSNPEFKKASRKAGEFLFNLIESLNEK